MGLALLLVTALSAIVSTADCYWSSTIYASTTTKLQSVTASAYDYYEFKIQPSPYSSSYYLEITWPSSKFDVTGNMPFCQEAYVEVFLTSYHQSIGKFCSNNAGAPFSMYSRDGYAKIVVSIYRLGAKAGVSFYYQLKSKSYSPLGGSSISSLCYNTYNYGSSGVIYSTGWPYDYKTSSSACNYQIHKSYSYQGIRFSFMDINLYYSYYSSSDCVQLYGSNYSSYYYSTSISPKFCGTSNIRMYNTYSNYLYINFDRQNKPSYRSNRGFVAGYIMFRAPTSTLTTTSPTTKPAYSSNFPVVAIVLGVVLPIVIITIIVIGVIFCVRKRQRSTAWDADNSHPQCSSTVSTAQHTTTQQTLQTAAPPAYTTIAFSQPQQFYPTASMQGAMYPMGTHHVVHPTTQSYSTGQFTSTGNAPPQYSFVVAPTQRSMPAGALQPARAPVVQAQQPTGALNPVPSSSSHSGGSAPVPTTLVQMPHNVPPPAYCDVVKS